MSGVSMFWLMVRTERILLNRYKRSLVKRREVRETLEEVKKANDIKDEIKKVKDELSKLYEERSKLADKIADGKATNEDKKRYKDIQKRIDELNKKIDELNKQRRELINKANKKLSVETKIVKSVKEEYESVKRTVDQLCAIDYEEEVNKVVEEAFEKKNPDIIRRVYEPKKVLEFMGIKFVKSDEGVTVSAKGG